MGMTMAEKILSSHSGKEKVTPGEYVWADIDAGEIPNVLIETSPVHWLEKLGIDKLFNPERVYARNSNLPTSIGWAENTASLRKLGNQEMECPSCRSAEIHPSRSGNTWRLIPLRPFITSFRCYNCVRQYYGCTVRAICSWWRGRIGESGESTTRAERAK